MGAAKERCPRAFMKPSACPAKLYSLGQNTQNHAPSLCLTVFMQPSAVPTPESLLALTFPSDPQLSPDGQQVAYVLSRVEEENPRKADKDWAKPRYKGQIWLADAEASQTAQASRPLTHGETGRGDSSPRFSPDGQTLAFIRSAGEVKAALMLLPLAGGEARRVTHFGQGIQAPVWSPDGAYIAFLTGGDEEDKRDERGEARVITQPRYRFNGRDWLPDTPPKLWLYAVQSGELREWHAPAQDLAGLTWQPDSGGVLFISSKDQKHAYQWKNEVYSLALGDTRPKQLTDWQSSLSAVVPHPDGQRLALVGRRAGKGNTENAHLYLWDAGKVMRLDAGHDHPVGNLVGGDCHVGAMPEKPVWLDDQTILFSSTVRGSCGLFQVSIGGEVSAYDHHPEEVIAGWTANAAGVALLRERATQFPEVELNGRLVTELGAALPFAVRAPERLTFQNELGEGEGWVLLPDAPTAPALLSIHGGPHTDYGHAFVHEFQLLAAHGYGVCYSNPRGSVGYGQAWVDDIYGRWGSVDMDDLLNFFDRCLEQFPQLDRHKTGVMGGSYGGFMTNWITAHTRRFQVAITDRSICNLISFGGTSDIGLQFWTDELGLNFARRADAAKLWDLSPLQYVENVTTPTLIVHSVLDHRCPIEQAEQWYAALHLHDVPVRFVRFPSEDHELSRSGRPDRRIKRLHEYLDWLGQWLSPNGGRSAASAQPQL